MKKLLVFVLCLGLVFPTLAGCNSLPENMHKSTYDLGCDAVKVVEDYLDGKITEHQAVWDLDVIYEELDEYELGIDQYESYMLNSLIKGRVSMLRVEISGVFDNVLRDSIISLLDSLKSRIEHQ